MDPTRRSFIGGLISAFAAPAIVHAGNLMPIRPLKDLFLDIPVALDPSMSADFYLQMRGIVRYTLMPRLLLQVNEQSPMLRLAREALYEEISGPVLKFPVDG